MHAPTCGTLISIFSLAFISPTQAVTYQIVTEFPTSNYGGPVAGLTLSPDGTTFYGTKATEFTNSGEVFSVGVDGSQFDSLHSFQSFSVYPSSSVIQNGSTLFGTATSLNSGFNYTSQIYSLNTNGSGFQVLHSFGGSPPSEGGVLNSQLTLVNSVLYGTITGPGALLQELFSLNTDGSNFQVLHAFPQSLVPSSGLLQVGSTLYGAASGDSVDGLGGAVYSYDMTTSTYHVLATIPSDQPAPVGNLTLVGSTLFGMTSNGVVSVGLDGSNYQTLLSFNQPTGAVHYWPEQGFYPNVPGGLTA